MADLPERARRVELILHEVDRLPTLGPVAARLLTVAGDDDADMDEISRLVESDPALSSTMLAMCRRAHTGLGDKITTVRRAIAMLGLDAVRSTVLSVSVYELMQRRAGDLDEQRPEGDEDTSFDRAGVWKHAVATAVGAELIARQHPALGVRPDLAFVSGLLCDLGRLVLELVLPNGYARVIAAARSRCSDTAPIERELIGLDHHTAGKRIAEHWGLPEPIRDAVWLHGQPLAGVPEIDNRALVGVVTLAKAWARRQHLGWSADFGTPADLDAVARDVGADAGALPGLLPTLIEQVAERCKVLGLDEQSEPQLLLESVARANRDLHELNRSLTRRAAQADARAAVLDAIARFDRDVEPGQGVIATLGAIARSAVGAFGAGYCGAVYQAEPSRGWQFFQFHHDGRVERSELVEAQAGTSLAGALGSIGSGEGVSMGSVGILPAMMDFVANAADLRRVRVLPLRGEGLGAALFHESSGESPVRERPALDALVGSWASALGFAASHEKARRLGDRLAELNRKLHEAQEALTEQASLARLGEMAAGAAHEMNNPLTVIRGRSQLLGERLTDPRDISAAQSIAASAHHLSQLIESLHLVAAPSGPIVQTIDPMLVVRGAADAARVAAGDAPGGTVRVRHEGEHRRVRTDRDLAMRALAAVITNAIEASPSKFVEVGVQTDLADGRWQVRVSDQGPGFSPRALRHAFDPFFSEKPAGRQRGLGLSEARALVDLMGGKIALSNGPDRGAVVTVTFDEGAQQGGRRAA